MKGHRQRRGQRPGRGRPDDGVDLAAGERRSDRLRVRGKPIAHIHRWAGVHLVLDFGLGQRRAVVDAPVDRLQSAINEALFEEPVKHLQRPSLVVARHGFVRLIPAAKAADALKLRGLQIDVFLRIGAAGIQHLGDRHLQLFAAELLVDFDLDRQAMAVVAGNVGRVEAGHGLRLDHKVLQPLVQRVAQVDGAIRIRRAIVKQIRRAFPAQPCAALHRAAASPPCQPKWLILGQIGLHWKGGLGKRKGRLQFGRCRHLYSWIPVSNEVDHLLV